MDACILCLFFKNCGGKKQGSLHPIPKHARPFHMVHLDQILSLPMMKKGNWYILLLVDAFTKFLWLTQLCSQTKKEIIKLENIMAVTGAPVWCITDRAPSFMSDEFEDFCNQHGIKHHSIATSMPRANGQAEIYVKEGTNVLQNLTKMGEEWDEILVKVQLGLNNSVCEIIGVTPTQALLGFNMAIDTFLNLDSEKLVDVTKIWKDMVKRIKTIQKKQKECFDAKRAKPQKFEIGDLVLVKISSIVTTGQGCRLKD